MCGHRDPGTDVIADKPGQFRGLLTALSGLSGRRILPWTVWDGMAVIVLSPGVAAPEVLASLVTRLSPEMRVVLSRPSPTRCLIRPLLLQTQPLMTLATDNQPFVDVEHLSLLGIIAAKLAIDLAEMPAWLQRFFEGDKDHHHKWSETVQALLRSNLNVAETAQMLYVHQNTIYYRLDTINKYCGVDIRNPISLADLQVALQLRATASNS